MKSPLDSQGTLLLLEPTETGEIEIALKYKEELYSMGIPVITFSSDDISLTADELKSKGVKFKMEPTKTDWGYECIFDDANGNYIQLIQMNRKYS